MNIIIIGSGWYGLHTYLLLQNTGHKVTILEKNDKIFDNSSNFNQNRLHLGYHYPRSSKTRQLCIDGYNNFILKYRDIVDFIDFNYYLISNKSILDYETYIQIFNDDNYQHNIIENKYFKNIDGYIINTKEKIINSDKAKQYFEDRICKENIKFNYKVTDIVQDDGIITINNDLKCDLLIDCTYNQLNLCNQDCYYELTISLIYERINYDDKFESITVMDGEFFSLFPRDISKKMYTLTHVKYTPLIQSKNISDIENYKLDTSTLKNIINNMENETIHIYPQFRKHYKYISYFLSYKCKLDNINASRQCVIQEDNNIISVHCGKITGIFLFEEFLKNKLNL